MRTDKHYEKTGSALNWIFGCVKLVWREIDACLYKTRQFLIGVCGGLPAYCRFFFCIGQKTYPYFIMFVGVEKWICCEPLIVKTQSKEWMSIPLVNPGTINSSPVISSSNSFTVGGGSWRTRMAVCPAIGSASNCADMGSEDGHENRIEKFLTLGIPRAALNEGNPGTERSSILKYSHPNSASTRLGPNSSQSEFLLGSCAQVTPLGLKIRAQNKHIHIYSKRFYRLVFRLNSPTIHRRVSAIGQLD